MILAHLSPLVNHLWQSTLCVALVWLLTLTLRNNRASVRYWLWMAASMKFVVPLSLLVSAGSQLGGRAAPALTQPGVVFVIEEMSRPLSISAPLRGVAGVAPGRDASPAIAFCLWFGGFAAALLCWFRSWRRVRAIRRMATPIASDLPIRLMSSPTCLEPGLFGVLNPVLLIPEGITTLLTPSQLDAILEHELCHARRRDNLTGAIHMIVETIFWFHPLVWWIGKRLMEERERACDEQVLSRTGDPETYAEGILAVCRFYLRSPLLSASGITGSNLRKRIETIVANPDVHSLDLRRKLVLALAGAATVTIPFAIGVVSSPATLAQSPAAGGKRLGFEVASIKASKPGGNGSTLLTDRAGGFTTENATLRTIIAFAFGVRGFEMSGGPSWLDSDRFDIVAKPEARSTPAQVPQMVQSLLADRFQLKFHRETKEMRVLALVAGKNGPKLKPTKPEDDAARPNRGFQGGSGELTALGADMAALATRLSAIVGLPVIDRTALTGRFDFKLQWTPDSPVQMKSPDEPVAASEHGPSIFTAVQQLGLKLESQKRPVDIIVIDSVEKPSSN
jgi:uncharacterized protein (TIGR03435 family)